MKTSTSKFLTVVNVGAAVINLGVIAYLSLYALPTLKTAVSELEAAQTKPAHVKVEPRSPKRGVAENRKTDDNIPVKALTPLMQELQTLQNDADARQTAEAEQERAKKSREAYEQANAVNKDMDIASLIQKMKDAAAKNQSSVTLYSETLSVPGASKQCSGYSCAVRFTPDGWEKIDKTKEKFELIATYLKEQLSVPTKVAGSCLDNYQDSCTVTVDANWKPLKGTINSY